jgi:hypothetical protein
MHKYAKKEKRRPGSLRANEGLLVRIEDLFFLLRSSFFGR